MRKILILLLILMSAKLLAIELPKDTLWVGYVPDLINNAMFSRNETKIYVNTKVGFSVLDTKTGKTIDEVKGLGNIGALSLDENYFINVHPEDRREKLGNVEKYDMKTRQLLWKCPKREKDDLLDVAFSENGKFALLLYSGANLDVYNVESQELVKSLQFDKFYFYESAFAIDNNGEKVILSLPLTKIINLKEVFGITTYLIELSSGNILKEMNFQEGITHSLSAMFSAKNNYALSRINDLIEVLDLRTMKSFIYNPSGGGGYGSQLGIISPDEKLLISGGCNEGQVELFDLFLNKIVYTMPRYSIGNNDFAVIDRNNDKLILQYKGQALVSFDLNRILSDVPLSNQQQIILSPNPVKNKISISNPQNHQINTLTAYDILGRMYPLSANGNEVDISALVAGKYFLKVGLADGSFLDFGFVVE